MMVSTVITDQQMIGRATIACLAMKYNDYEIHIIHRQDEYPNFLDILIINYQSNHQNFNAASPVGLLSYY
jgi:hypothetical protein